jgi:hypothetical protein
MAAAIAGILYYRSRSVRRLTEKDTIVLADFANTTGDSVFDDTLKQALAVDLQQSPFLNVLSDEKAAESLKLMNRSAHDRQTQEVAREVCLRTGSKANAGWLDCGSREPLRDHGKSGQLPDRRFPRRGGDGGG